MTTKKKQMDNAGKLPFSALREIALKEARKIHREKVEHGIVIDDYGEIKRFGGRQNAVDIPLQVLTSAKIIVHNHPSEANEPSSFSGRDVKNLLQYNIGEIIVCGYGCYFSMRRGSCRILSGIVEGELDSLYSKIKTKAEKKYLNAIGVTNQNYKAAYKKYAQDIERTYHRELKEYARRKDLSYMRSKL